jgi:hypothetical protein
VNAGPEVERARQVLATMIDLSMMSRREVARRMAERGINMDLGRVLRGRLHLRFCHVAAICQALDLHPLEFCRMVFGEPKERSPFLQRIEALLGPLKR